MIRGTSMGVVVESHIGLRGIGEYPTSSVAQGVEKLVACCSCSIGCIEQPYSSDHTLEAWRIDPEISLSEYVQSCL